MKLSRIALGMAIAALPLAGAQANQALNSAGTSATLGGVSNPGSIHSSSANPASSNIMVREGERFRFGYLSNFGMYLELGEVDDIDDKVELFIDDLEAIDIIQDNNNNMETLSGEDRETVDNQFARFQGQGCDTGNNATLAECYQAVADSINEDLLDDLNKGGNIRTGFSASAPLMPFLFKGGRDWTFGVNVAAHGQFKGEFIGERFGVRSQFKTQPVGTASASTTSSSSQTLGELNIDAGKIGQAYVTLQELIDEQDANPEDDADFLTRIADRLVGDGVLSEDEVTVIRNIAQQYEDDPDSFADQELVVDADLTTDSAMEARAAGIVQLSVNYAHNLTSALNLDPRQGTLEAGARLNYYQTRMHRGFSSARGAAEDYETIDGDDSVDRAGDFFADEYKQDSALGLDVGVLWHARNYQVGATMYNINEPSFDYPNLDDLFANPLLDENGDVFDLDQQVANNLANKGRLDLKESVTLTRHTVLEAAYFNDNRTWSLHGYYTLGTATNFVGDEFQDAGISAGYFTQSWLIPGVRAGYNKNLTGTELTTVSAGGTFFGIFNLDMAMSLDNSTVDGTEFPRYFAINLGFQEKF